MANEKTVPATDYRGTTFVDKLKSWWAGGGQKVVKPQGSKGPAIADKGKLPIYLAYAKRAANATATADVKTRQTRAAEHIAIYNNQLRELVVAKLKEQHAGEIQVHGSAHLAQTLHAHGLIDEYRLFIEPVVLGTGKRLFEPGAEPTSLQLVESRAMAKGAVFAVYRPSGQPTYGEFVMEEGFGLPES